MQICGATATRNPTVGIEIGEGLLFDLIELDRLDLVRHLELLKEKDGLGKTGPQQRSWRPGSKFTFQEFGPGAGSESTIFLLSRKITATYVPAIHGLALSW